jgi:hypothetical protein
MGGKQKHVSFAAYMFNKRQPGARSSRLQHMFSMCYITVWGEVDAVKL